MRGTFITRSVRSSVRPLTTLAMAWCFSLLHKSPNVLYNLHWTFIRYFYPTLFCNSTSITKGALIVLSNLCSPKILTWNLIFLHRKYQTLTQGICTELPRTKNLQSIARVSICNKSKLHTSSKVHWGHVTRYTFRLWIVTITIWLKAYKSSTGNIFNF